jgi:hypothetical protein
MIVALIELQRFFTLLAQAYFEIKKRQQTLLASSKLKALPFFIETLLTFSKGN